MPAVNSNSKSGNIDGRVCAFAIQIFSTLCAYEISWFFMPVKAGSAKSLCGLNIFSFQSLESRGES